MEPPITWMLLISMMAGCASKPKDVKATHQQQTPHKEVRRIANHHSGRVTLVLVDREKSLFRISNDSGKTIQLATLYMPGTGEEFNSTYHSYEVWRNGKWVRLPWSIDGVSWNYPLPPHKSLIAMIPLSHFEIDLSQNEIGNISKGDLVRVWLDEYPSKPFRW